MHYPPLLSKGCSDVGHVAHQEPGAGGVEAAVWERQAHGVGFHEGQALFRVLGLADKHHLVGEVRADDRHVRVPAQCFQGNIAGAGGDVEHQRRGPGLQSPPQRPGDEGALGVGAELLDGCLLYTSPSPRDRTRSRMQSSACNKNIN